MGYNVQSVVDAETHLIVTHEVTNQGHDRDQLASMAGAAKTALRRDDLHILADKAISTAIAVASTARMTIRRSCASMASKAR